MVNDGYNTNGVDDGFFGWWAEVRGARAATPLGVGANPEGCQLELLQHGRHRGDGDGNLFQCPYLWELLKKKEKKEFWNGNKTGETK